MLQAVGFAGKRSCETVNERLEDVRFQSRVLGSELSQ